MTQLHLSHFTPLLLIIHFLLTLHHYRQFETAMTTGHFLKQNTGLLSGRMIVIIEREKKNFFPTIKPLDFNTLFFNYSRVVVSCERNVSKSRLF